MSSVLLYGCSDNYVQEIAAMAIRHDWGRSWVIHCKHKVVYEFILCATCGESFISAEG